MIEELRFKPDASIGSALMIAAAEDVNRKAAQGRHASIVINGQVEFVLHSARVEDGWMVFGAEMKRKG